MDGAERVVVMHGRRLEHTAAFGGGGARGLRRVRYGGCAAARMERGGGGSACRRAAV